MKSRWTLLAKFVLTLALGFGTLSMAPIEAEAIVKRLTIRGRLSYRSGSRGKSFVWRLRLYTTTGIIIGSGNDRDGRATFFGTYNQVTRKFRMVKRFTRGKGTKLFYKGKIRGSRLYGTAHSSSFWGRRYASWSARTTFSRYKFSRGTPKRFYLRGKLRFFKGGSKSFTWNLRYYPSSGRCYGTTRDREGKAVFEGVYDRPTKRFFLRKRFFGSNRYLYYRGYITGNRVWGTARRYSFTSRKTYGSWRAKMLWKSGGGEADVDAPPRQYRRRRPSSRIKHFTLRGKLYYKSGGSKSFTWKLRYYPTSKKCFGETFDKDGKASFFGSCNPDTGRIQLRKRFRGSSKYLYYTGRLTRKGARGVATARSFYGRTYATWRARIIRRTR